MPARLIDTHLHTWNFERASYEWLKDDTSILNRSYFISELNEVHEQAGVTEGVLVQAANNFEDTDWMLQVADENDWITGVVGWVPLMDPGATEKALAEKYLNNKYFKGIRHLIHDEPDAKWILQDSVLESLKILSRRNLPYDIVGIKTDHIESALTVAEKVPDLKMIFDHINQPPIASKEKFGVWGELMKEASKHKNFYVKISGLGAASKKGENWNASDVRPYIEFALEVFGEDRCLCGGNWPVCLLTGSYGKAWDIYREVIGSLLDEEGKEKVCFKNAVQFYNL